MTAGCHDRDTWVRLNAEYPGFQHFLREDCVGEESRAAGRAHVTSESEGCLQHVEVATFITLPAGLIDDMTEVWTDVDEVAQGGTRPVRRPSGQSLQQVSLVDEAPPTAPPRLTIPYPRASRATMGVRRVPRDHPSSGRR
jgi:hypothetical protein